MQNMIECDFEFAQAFNSLVRARSPTKLAPRIAEMIEVLRRPSIMCHCVVIVLRPRPLRFHGSPSRLMVVKYAYQPSLSDQVAAGLAYALHLAKIASKSSATILVILIAGLTAGPAVSL